MWHIEYLSARTGRWLTHASTYDTLWLAWAAALAMMNDGLAVKARPICDVS